MTYEINFYENNGRKIVEEFIYSLSKSTIGKLLRIVDLLEKYGVHIGMPYTKKINKIVWELRSRGKEEIRLLFFVKGTKIIILHGFKKKQHKIPLKEIEIAEKRIENI